jgi:hypothetical protein
MTAIEVHLELSRKQAHRLLRDARRPIEIRLSTIAAAAGVLFTAGVVGGFALRAWQLVQ